MSHGQLPSGVRTHASSRRTPCRSTTIFSPRERWYEKCAKLASVPLSRGAAARVRGGRRRVVRSFGPRRKRGEEGGGRRPPDARDARHSRAASSSESGGLSRRDTQHRSRVVFFVVTHDTARVSFVVVTRDTARASFPPPRDTRHRSRVVRCRDTRHRSRAVRRRDTRHRSRVVRCRDMRHRSRAVRRRARPRDVVRAIIARASSSRAGDLRTTRARHFARWRPPTFRTQGGSGRCSRRTSRSGLDVEGWVGVFFMSQASCHRLPTGSSPTRAHVRDHHPSGQA